MKDLKQENIDLKKEVDAFERTYIDRAMELAGGNSSRAAQLLGCTRFTLKRRLEQGGEGVMKDIHSLLHSKWRCQYHIAFAPKYRRRKYMENFEQISDKY